MLTKRLATFQFAADEGSAGIKDFVTVAARSISERPIDSLDSRRQVAGEVGRGKLQLPACGLNVVATEDRSAECIPPLHLPGPIGRHGDCHAKCPLRLRSLAVVLRAPSALATLQPNQQKLVALQSERIETWVAARPIGRQDHAADLQPVTLRIGEREFVTARGHVNRDLLVIVADPDFPLLQTVGRLPRPLARLPCGQRHGRA